MQRYPLVIVGGGHAAAQLCASLEEKGLANGVLMLSAEDLLPYQRPPLSKSYLKNAQEQAQLIRPASWYEKAGVQCRLSETVIAIDRPAKTLQLADGESVAYERLVLATGTRARPWPMLQGAPSNALSLRTAADASRLRDRWASSEHVVVLGGGFIGLEVAATANALGKRVTVLETAGRLMGRSVSPALAQHVHSVHQAQGIGFRLGSELQGAKLAGGCVTHIGLTDAELPCDLLLLAIGAEPQTQLAQQAGLACDNGICVDAQLRTSDPDIFALGDVAAFPGVDGRQLRLESIQNANDQAKVLASVLAGESAVYQALPWFWSEQGHLRLQMVGLLSPSSPTQMVRREGSQAGSFSLFHYADSQLVCVESVNAPLDHMMARKLLDAQVSPDPAAVGDPAVLLKTLIP
ncbi:MAG: hypothetical protein RL758_569 [Pseudomonadota bacterium]|jgi:3-phenylpropionate/trans-cinnamate dioxygenase ferredoxin reductase subunit